MGKRVVCTGANGFIGTHTVRTLLEKGYEVIALDIETERLQKLLGDNPNLSIWKLDITKDDLRNILQISDKILHLAAIARFITREQAAKAVKVNVTGTIRLLEAAVKKRAERFVYASTGSVYASDVTVPIRENGKLGPRYDNYYGWSKLQAEQWIRIYQQFIPHVILRYAYVYGVLKDWGAIGDWVYNKIPNNETPIIYGGKQTNDFIYVKDVVKANLLALESEHLNEIYNIGTGRDANIYEACQICLELSNSPLKAKILPPRSFDYPIFIYDISKAKTLLGYSPEWCLREGVYDMMKEIR